MQEETAFATSNNPYAFLAAKQVAQENLYLADNGSRDGIDGFLKTSLGLANNNGRSAISTLGTLDFENDAQLTSSELNLTRGQTTFANLGIINERQSYQVGYQYGLNERNQLNLERAAIEIQRARALQEDGLQTSLNQTSQYYEEKQTNASTGFGASGYAVAGALAKSGYNLGLTARGLYRLVTNSETKILAANTGVNLLNHPLDASRATFLAGYRFSQQPLGEQSSAIGQFALDLAVGAGVAKGLGVLGDIAENAAANSTSFYRSIPNEFGQFPLANGASAGLDFGAVETASKIKSSTQITTGSTSSAVQTYYPPNRGFFGQPTLQDLGSGYQFDRYGGFFDESGIFNDFGTFVAPANTPYRMRALPPGTDLRPLTTYEVIKPISGVPSGSAAPYFGELGLGTQHELPLPIQDYLDQGYIRIINQAVPKKH